MSRRTAEPRRVVITGIGIVSPLGISSAEHWRRRVAGESGIGRIEAFDPSGFECHVGGEVQPFKITDHVPKTYRKFSKVMARDIELAVVAAKDAFTSSGIKSKADGEADFEPSRFGCNIGAGLISAELNELAEAMHRSRSDTDRSRIDWQQWGREGLPALTPLWLLKYLPNMLACHVTIIHGLTGPSNNITCAEASGHLSIGEAMRSIQRGKADLAIAGGIESMMNPMGLMRQELLGRLTNSGVVRPFDKNADGTAMGEGGALLILEEMIRAQERGATIYAELAGFASSQDTFDPTLPDPEGKAYAAAAKNALRDAEADAGDVDLVVPHGLAIPHHDASEVAGLRRVFGDEVGRPAVAPGTAQTSTLAAGSAVAVADAVMALHTGTVPPALGVDAPIAPLNLAPASRDLSPKLALAPVFSLGGQNAAVVLRKGE